MIFDIQTQGVTTTPTGVPEPGALALFGLGLLLVGTFVGLRRRQYARPAISK